LWAASMGTDSGYCIGSSCITAWSQLQGQTGPQGPAGATGATGPQGPAGPAGSGTHSSALYSCPNVPADAAGNSCGGSTCGGNVSVNSTCSVSTGGIGGGENSSYYCIGANTYSCTFIGYLVQ
jgi:hypothetical protein